MGIRHWMLAVAGVCILATGCGTEVAGVEELLRAPQQQGPQTEVQRALRSYLGELPQLKYPSQGSVSSPFLFGDWDGDGQMDAAVLFTSPSKGQNVRLAILEQQGEGWTVTQEREGLATNVDSVGMAALHAEGGTQLLVGYSAPSGEKYLAVYLYHDDRLSEVMERPYSQYEVQDITGSGMQDLIVIGPQSQEGLEVQLLTSVEGKFVQAQTLQIPPERFSVCEALSASRGLDGISYLVLDGRSQTSGSLSSLMLQYNQTTQQLEVFDPWGNFIFERSQRFSSLLLSRDIDGNHSVEIPCIIGPTEQGSSWMFVVWEDYTDPIQSEKSFGVVDLEYGYYLALPGESSDYLPYETEFFYAGYVGDDTVDEVGGWGLSVQFTVDTGEQVWLPFLEVHVEPMQPLSEEDDTIRLGYIGMKQVEAYVSGDLAQWTDQEWFVEELRKGFLPL